MDGSVSCRQLKRKRKERFYDARRSLLYDCNENTPSPPSLGKRHTSVISTNSILLLLKNMIMVALKDSYF
jgi:hypothetical protein